MRPRSADPLRHRLEVPVDAGMAALGFMSDDANAAPAPALGNTPSPFLTALYTLYDH